MRVCYERGRGEQKGRDQERPEKCETAPPAYLGQEQGALAGSETLGALGTQLGVSHLFASVRGKSKFGNQCWPWHWAARTWQVLFLMRLSRGLLIH